MAQFIFGNAETQERFRESLSLPVDRDKMTLSRWVMWKLQSYGFEDTVTLWADPREENCFDFAVKGVGGERIIVGGLLYRDGGWESHT